MGHHEAARPRAETTNPVILLTKYRSNGGPWGAGVEEEWALEADVELDRAAFDGDENGDENEGIREAGVE